MKVLTFLVSIYHDHETNNGMIMRSDFLQRLLMDEHDNLETNDPKGFRLFIGRNTINEIPKS